MQGRMNIPVRGGGGEGASLNVFAQATEPATKKGIWINTSATGSLPAINKFDYEGIEISSENYEEEFDIIYEKDMPSYLMYGCHTVLYKKYIFFFGADTTYTTYVYRYDPDNKKYTRLQDTPFPLNGSHVVLHEKYIYLLGGTSTYGKYVYRYDPDNDTYTRLPDLPFEFKNNGFAVSCGAYIYLLGNGVSTDKLHAYKYSPTNNTCTAISDLPYDISSGNALSHGNYIYLVSGSSSYRTSIYRYDPDSDKYTQLQSLNTPNITHIASFCGEYIYTIGASNGTIICSLYRHDLSNGTTTELKTLPWYVYNKARLIFDGKYLHILSGNYTKTLHAKIAINIQLTNNNIYLFTTTDKQNVELVDGITAPIAQARIYADNEFKDYPAYYGDGTQWLPLQS